MAVSPVSLSSSEYLESPSSESSSSSSSSSQSVEFSSSLSEDKSVLIATNCADALTLTLMQEKPVFVFPLSFDEKEDEKLGPTLSRMTIVHVNDDLHGPCTTIDQIASVKYPIQDVEDVMDIIEKESLLLLSLTTPITKYYDDYLSNTVFVVFQYGNHAPLQSSIYRYNGPAAAKLVSLLKSCGWTNHSIQNPI